MLSFHWRRSILTFRTDLTRTRDTWVREYDVTVTRSERDKWVRDKRERPRVVPPKSPASGSRSLLWSHQSQSLHRPRDRRTMRLRGHHGEGRRSAKLLHCCGFPSKWTQRWNRGTLRRPSWMIKVECPPSALRFNWEFRWEKLAFELRSGPQALLTGTVVLFGCSGRILTWLAFPLVLFWKCVAAAIFALVLWNSSKNKAFRRIIEAECIRMIGPRDEPTKNRIRTEERSRLTSKTDRVRWIFEFEHRRELI